MCGEHVHHCAVAREFPGSSPRVWGALPIPAHARRSARLSPTCVGSTLPRLMSPQRICGSYPHVCGEHLVVMPLLVAYGGSSPRVWGAPRRPLYRSLTGRLIPTCVGSTLGWCSSLPAAPAHPHVCGEHISPFAAHGSAVGSSPRVWGAQRIPTLNSRKIRLIPTCVGSTARWIGFLLTCSAHPHVCGEHVLVTNGSSGCIGSSPRVWGAHGV